MVQEKFSLIPEGDHLLTPVGPADLSMSKMGGCQSSVQPRPNGMESEEEKNILGFMRRKLTCMHAKMVQNRKENEKNKPQGSSMPQVCIKKNFPTICARMEKKMMALKEFLQMHSRECMTRVSREKMPQSVLACHWHASGKISQVRVKMKEK